jgi:hypothetical protein
MKHQSIIKTLPLNGESKLSDLQRSLEMIEHKLDDEVQAKQLTIERLELEIQRLHLLIEGKDKIILDTSEKYNECLRNSEGNRQLINKLINDIERLNQDINWYKKTYENRSLLGILKQKVVRQNNNRQ